MKNIGILLVIIGIVGLLWSSTIDTTVKVEDKNYGYGIKTEDMRVHNIGLMNEKQNYIILSSIILLSGVIMTSISSLHKTESNDDGKLDFICNHCSNINILDDNELLAKKYICPECNKENLI